MGKRTNARKKRATISKCARGGVADERPIDSSGQLGKEVGRSSSEKKKERGLISIPKKGGEDNGKDYTSPEYFAKKMRKRKPLRESQTSGD